MRTYTQLTQEQRYQIYAFLKAELNQSEIANIVGIYINQQSAGRDGVTVNSGVTGPNKPINSHGIAARQSPSRAFVTRTGAW